MNPSHQQPHLRHHHHPHHSHLLHPQPNSSCGPLYPSDPKNGAVYVDESQESHQVGIQQSSHQQHWVKSSHHSLSSAPHGNPNSSCSSSSTGIYGASTSHNYLQQSFYPHPPFGGGDLSCDPSQTHFPPLSIGNNNSPSSSSCTYYPKPSDSRGGGTDYFHHHLPPPPVTFTPFDTIPKRRGQRPSSSSDQRTFYSPSSTVGQCSNFYSSSVFSQQIDQSHFTSAPPPEFLEYSRMHYGSGSTNSSGDYFSGPVNRPSSSCPSSYGHHHVEFSQQPHHLEPPPSFRRNSIESFSSEPGQGYKFGYAGANPHQRVSGSQHVVMKREPEMGLVGPSWNANMDANSESKQFFPEPNHSQYQGRPTSVPGHHNQNHACEPQVLTSSPCSFDAPTGTYRKVGGVKQRSQSLSFARNFESQSHFHRSGITNYGEQLHPRPVPPTTADKKLVPDSVGPNQGQATDNCLAQFPGDCNESEGGSGSDEDDGDSDEDSSGDNESGKTDEEPNGVSPTSGDDDGGPSDDTSISSSPDDESNEDDELSDLKIEIEGVTTTSEVIVGGSGITGTSHHLPPDPGKLNAQETELSTSSLTLFDSISLSSEFESPDVSTVVAEVGSDNQGSESITTRELLDDPEDSLSGLSSISSGIEPSRRGHRLNSTGCELTILPSSRSPSPGLIPGKIIKRSFSETDKELVINTSAITTAAASLAYGSSSKSKRRVIPIPKGWRRDITNSNSSPQIYYISPSETKLRNLEEVKNYITSDGTCKCGLQCPLHIEVVFNFDPKIGNATPEMSDMSNDKAGTSFEIVGNNDGKIRPSGCCGQKRRIPLSEDSPLISSTRDDLGDYAVDGNLDGSHRKKRRRESPTLDELSTTGTSKLPKTNTGITVPGIESELELKATSLTLLGNKGTLLEGHPMNNGNTVVPFAQQSPDTTTQTPHRDMSPASSVASDQSSGPPSLLSNPKTSPTTNSLTTPPPKTSGSGTTEFAWPIPVARSQTPPTVPVQLSVPTSQTTSHRKSSPTHHLIPKNSSLKRASSPCPNVDVRQIPFERNQPPPPARLQLTNTGRISVRTPPPSQPNPATVASNFPVRVVQIPSSFPRNEPPSLKSSSTPLSSGYTISPVLTNQGCGGELPRLKVPTSSMSSLPRSTSSSKLQPNPVTISVIDQNDTSASGIEITSKSQSKSGKSPLELAQDVVDRFDGPHALADSNQKTIDSERKVFKEEVSTEKSLETKILKIIADTASTNVSSIPPITADRNDIIVPPKIDATVSATSTALPASAVLNVTASPLPTSISIHPISFANTVPTLTTTSAPTQTSIIPIMNSSPLLNCSGSTNSLPTINQSTGSQLILQPQPTSADPGNSSLRYPIFQTTTTLQPFFLNPGTGSAPLLFPNGPDAQSYFQIDQNTQAHHNVGPAELLHPTTMVIDPMTMCGGGIPPNFLGPLTGGAKKKKKRLSKKQQQQQAQLALQQQLLLQQLFNHQQQSVQATQQLPLLLPPSFNLGPQGFLQPMNMNMNMNFYPTPTILTVSNVMLNQSDGTLFLQQPGGLTPGGTTSIPSSPSLKVGPSGLTGGTIPLSSNPNFSISTGRKESNTPGPSVDGIKESILGIDDSSRQNPTPDSSTNDLGLVGGVLPMTGSTGSLSIQPSAVLPSIISSNSSSGPLTVSLPLGSSTNLQGTSTSSGKKPLKSKVVSSSTTHHKRILPQQKQILPKIDSTTSSVENNN